ncbi:hypothetical protein TW93_11720 [Bacillus pumilus]|nr:hypothetical protein TW93_11720 [Bacillus pumilus]
MKQALPTNHRCLRLQGGCRRASIKNVNKSYVWQKLIIIKVPSYLRGLTITIIKSSFVKSLFEKSYEIDG